MFFSMLHLEYTFALIIHIERGKHKVENKFSFYFIETVHIFELCLLTFSFF